MHFKKLVEIKNIIPTPFKEALILNEIFTVTLLKLSLLIFCSLILLKSSLSRKYLGILEDLSLIIPATFTSPSLQNYKECGVSADFNVISVTSGL